MNDPLRRQLELLEGRRNCAYQDKLGFWTIGVGRLIDCRKAGGLSEEEVDYLLTNDIAKVTAQAQEALPWFDGLNEARQAVILGMLFQMGLEGTLQFVRALGAMRDQRWPQAAEEMKQSQWADQTPGRVKLLALQMETGEWQA